MLYHTKIIIRNLHRNGLYSLINIFGLAASMTACIFILLWVYDELTYEKIYSRSNDICLVIVNFENDGHDDFYLNSPTAVSFMAKESIPEVENACSVNMYYDLGYVEYENRKFFDKFIMADSSFFRIFDNVFVEGSVTNAFLYPHSVVLTQSLAKRIFGDEPATGKILTGGYGDVGTTDSYHVSGVVKDPPRNTVMQYKAVFSSEDSKHKNTWGSWNFQNFLLLRPGVDRAAVAKTIYALHLNRQPHDKIKSYRLQTLPDTHLYSLDGNEKGMASIRLFVLIVFILLTVSCVNYVNLVTARANKRNKEISVRKILGAKKGGLFFQLLYEVFLLFGAAFLLSLIFVALTTPFFNYMTGKEFHNILLHPVLWGICMMLFTFVMILAGIYPTIKLTSFRPMHVWHQPSTGKKSRISLQKILLIFQFTCTIGLLFSTIVMNSQLHYMLHKDLGYDKEQVLYGYIFSNQTFRSHYESFKAELEKEPNILGVSGSELNILDVSNFASGLHWEGQIADRNFKISTMGVDRNFFSLMDISIVEGSGFTGTPADSARYYFNETAIQQMGLENPVGVTVSMFGKIGVIAGVVKDFHFRKMDKPIGPIIMYLPPYYWTIYIKLASGKIPEAIASINNTWEKFNADFPFSYQFMDEAFQEEYNSDKTKGVLFNSFSVIAILISCLGLFALVTYIVESKTKEIGIRKVLGASIFDIVMMLSKEFLILVGIALFIAFPLAYYGLERMLQDYAYRISIDWWMFVLAGGITISLTLFTVGGKAVKAATAHPVQVLKKE